MPIITVGDLLKYCQSNWFSDPQLRQTNYPSARFVRELQGHSTTPIAVVEAALATRVDTLVAGSSESDASTQLLAEVRRRLSIAEPDTTPEFARLGVDRRLVQSLRDSEYKIVTPMETQIQVIPYLLIGRDAVVKAPTGTGKTAAYLVPILQQIMNGNISRALILVHTRDLALQVKEMCLAIRPHGFSLRGATLLGGVDSREKLKQESAIHATPQIITATPDRLLYLNSKFPDLHLLEGVELVIIDEADALLLDKKFRDPVTTILKLTSTRQLPQIALFSATLKQTIRETIKDFIETPVYIEIKPPPQVESKMEEIFYKVERGKFYVLSNILYETKGMPRLVICNTKAGAIQLSNDLSGYGYDNQVIHGEVQQLDRTRIYEQFQRGNPPLLIATDLAGRGKDFRFGDFPELIVVNYQVPFAADINNYEHRVGRTARGGRAGKAITLVASREEWTLLETLAERKSKKFALIEPPLMWVQRGRRFES